MARGLLQCGFWLLLVHLLSVTTAVPAPKHSNSKPQPCFKLEAVDAAKNPTYDWPKLIRTYGEITECTRQETDRKKCYCSKREERAHVAVHKPFKECLFDYPHPMILCPFFVVPFLVTMGLVTLMVWATEPKPKKETQTA